jgi:ABC-type spermidine/putrescine transport system permease subunit II
MQLTETHYGATAGAFIGLASWALQTYVFKGSPPPEVTAAVYVIVPGIVTGLTAFLTRKNVESNAAPPPAPVKEPV